MSTHTSIKVPLSAETPTRPVSGRRLEIDDSRWRRFLDRHPGAGPFHHPAWAELLADCYGFRPFVHAVVDAEGEPVAGLPLLELSGARGGLRWSSLPFTDSCEPLGSRLDDIQALMSTLDEARRSAAVEQVEIRGVTEATGLHETSRYVLHRLPLERDADAVFARFKRSQVQQPTLKAQSGPLTLEHGGRRELLDDFYRLHLRTRRRQGVPIQPRRFFELLWSRLLEPGLGSLLIARLEGRAVAAGVFLGWNRKVVYKLGASDPAFLRLRPNNLLLWTAIQRACHDGASTFDFGRTDLENEGLRRFKSGWAAAEQPLTYHVLADSPPAVGRRRAERALRPLLKHSPLWAVRMAGETLYRHAA